MTWLILAASAAVLLAAFFLWRHAEKRVAALGLAGEVIYSDGAVDEVFVSHVQGLTGRPDYILEVGGELVPVERKSRRVSAAGAYEGEILQLAAYCLLVEERFGKPVRRGQLQYPNRSIDIPFGDQLRRDLLAVLRGLQEAEGISDVPRSHSRPACCKGCGFRQVCRDSLSD